ncbi:MAG: nickel-dependent hydrogenase large subunit [Candidatus Ratteibacteria bacterium]
MKNKITIGPQHPALKEPISLRLTYDGDIITDADLRLGYTHRGLEKLAEGKSYIQNLYLTERICGICSHSHTTAFALGVEQLMGIEPPKRGTAIRTIIAELERIHSHLLWLGVAAHEIGFDSFFMYTWRDREHVLDILESISGNRIHYAINTFGGVRRDIDQDQRSTILEQIAHLQKRTEYYLNLGKTEPTLTARLAGVGKLSKEQAIDLCAVGPTTRASGVAQDIRKDDPSLSYPDVPFEIALSDTCDVLGRVVVRIKELISSYTIIEYLLKNLPDGEIRVKAPRKVPEGEVISRYEAPRGENIHYIKSNGTDKPERLKVRAPTLANYPATVEMLKNVFIADVPLIFAAIDPCVCCAERVIELVDSHTGRPEIITMSQLRTEANNYYRKKNIRNKEYLWPW